MKIGKVSETILKRSIFKQIRHRREEVLVRPGVGLDCSMVQVADDEVIVLSTDPITGAVKDIGTLAVHVTSNDIAASGAEIIGIMVSVLFPEHTSEAKLKLLIQDMEAVCAKLNIEIIGGHTEVTAAVNKPIVTVTGVGKLKKENVSKKAQIEPGQDIVMTKWAGLEGTAILAKEKEEELLTRYTRDYIDGAKQFIQSISIVREAQIGKDYGVTAMHDVTEGGIFGALWEFAASANVGMEIDLKKITLRQETVEICEFFDLNPYLLISSGCLLMATQKGNSLVEALKKEGIEASIIGTATAGQERIIRNEEEIRYLEPPKSDHLYKVL